MLSLTTRNRNLQAQFGSFLGEPWQKYFLPMLTDGPLKHVGTIVRFGEKTLFPFADDMISLVWHSCHPDKPTEDKWVNGKKDLKLCKGALNGRHLILTSHVLASTAIVFCSNKTPPSFVLLKVADASYQPVMEELCSEERYIDAEIFHKKIVGQRLKTCQLFPKNHLPSKSKYKPQVFIHEKDRSVLDFWVHSKLKMTFQLNSTQILVYGMARTKRMIAKNFNGFSDKRFFKINDNRAMESIGRVMPNIYIRNSNGAMKISSMNSKLLNSFLKTRSKTIKGSK